MLYIASGPALMRDAGHRQARKRKNNKGTPIIPYKKSHKDYPSRDLGAWENVFLFTPIRDKSMLKINEKKSVLDTVIPKQTYLDVSFQIHATPNVIPGLGYLEKSQYHPKGFVRNK